MRVTVLTRQRIYTTPASFASTYLNIRQPSLSRFRLGQFARIIRGGGILAYPTEAVYGLGCDPLHQVAVQRILDFKQRLSDKGLILIGFQFQQFEPFVHLVEDPRRMEQIRESWPGPYTWLLPARPDCPGWLTGKHTTLAVRVTDHPVAAAICREAGTALVSTSANRSGRPPARTAIQVRARCGDLIDGIAGGKTDRHRRPSCIRDALTGSVVRE